MGLFGALHLFYLSVLFFMIFQGCRSESWLNYALSRISFRRVLAVALILADIGWIWLTVQALDYSIKANMPFELCDMGLWAALFILIWPENKNLRNVGLFFCIAAPLMASLMPEVDPPSFLQQTSIAKFYFTHIWIIVIALHDVCNANAMPTWRDLRNAWLVCVGLAIPIWILNHTLDTNFFFVTRAPNSVQLLEAIPYPYYLSGWSFFILASFVLSKGFAELVWRLTRKN